MKYLYSILCLFISLATAAQSDRRPDFILEAAPFISANSNEFGALHEKYLSQSTPAGISGGGGILISTRSFSRFTSTMGLLYNKQTIYVDKDATRPIDYSNLDFYWKFQYGIQAKITPGSSLVFHTGMVLFVSLKNKSAQQYFLTVPYTDSLTGEPLNYLNGIYEKNGKADGSGSSRNGGTAMLNLLFSVGYETTDLLPGHRRCGVLLEFATRLTASNNNGTFYKFDRQRNLTGISSFTDNRTALGLNFYIALF